MIKNKILIILAILLTASINSYASEIVKPEIKRVAFWSGKWHISYSEVKNGTNLVKEELFVDGISDRSVNIGLSETRGFPLHGTYDTARCHKAYIVIYDSLNNNITQSDIFNFGDISKCNMENDVINPVLTLKGKNPQTIVKGEAYTEFGATAFDNKDGDISTNIVIDSTTVDTETVGDYSVNYSVVDATGNDVLVRRTVKVIEDVVLPSVEILGVSYFSGKWNIFYKDLAVSSNLGIEKVFVDDIEDRYVNAGSYSATLKRGFGLVKDYDKNTCHKAYIIIYDRANNEVSRTATFNFGDITKCTDTVKPILTLIGDASQTLVVGDTYIELGATAIDNIDGDISADIVVDATDIDTTKAGTYTVRYNVSDVAGNIASTLTRTVIIESAPLPTVEITGVKYYNNRWNIAYKDLPSSPNLGMEKVFIDGAFDRQVNGGVTSETLARGFRLFGTYSKDICHEAYIIIYDRANQEIIRTSVFNFGNIARCGEDNINPLITLVGANPQPLLTGDTYVELGATALDTRDGDISNKIIIDASSVDTNTTGEYIVTYNVKDIAGNNATTLERTVVVTEPIDIERPVIVLNGEKVQRLTVGDEYIEMGAIATDTKDGDITGSMVVNSSRVNINNPGEYLVFYTVSDEAGNKKVIKRKVIVKEPGLITGDYYISLEGNDSNDGKTLATAFRTVAHAYELAKGGDTILMKGGLYREAEIKVEKENNSNQYITLQNYNNEYVVLKGSEVVTEWENYQGNIWKLSDTNVDVNRSIHFQQVFYADGKSLQKVGYPNYIKSNGKNVWSFERRYIPIKENSDNPFGMSENTFYVEELDNAKFDLYVWLPDGKTPNDPDVTMEVSDKQFIMNVEDIDNLKFKGLSFMHTSGTAFASYDNGFQSDYGLVLGHGAIMEDCEIAYTAFSGLFLTLADEARGTDMNQRLTRCKIHHNGAVGVTTVAGGYIIEDSEFYENATRPFIQYWHTGAIKSAAQGWGEIKNNYIHDERSNGIWFDYCYSGGPILVHHNYLDKIGILKPNPLRKIRSRGDGLLFEQSTNIKAYNNIVNMTEQRGIYISNSEDVVITNNLIRKSLLQQLGLSDDDRTHVELKNIHVLNNIFIENRQSKNNIYDIRFYHSQGRKGTSFDESNELKNNIIYNSDHAPLLVMEAGNWSLDDNRIIDPMLNTNESARLDNWYLNSNSTAIDNATFYDFVTNDYNYNLRNNMAVDIGPFEK